MKHLTKVVALATASAALALPSLGAHAQSSAASPASSVAPSGKAADASDPKAAVPPLVYRSAFRSYRPNAEAEVGNWKEANDKVGRIGGWRVYAKEAAKEASQPDAAASAPAAADHSGHESNKSH